MIIVWANFLGHRLKSSLADDPILPQTDRKLTENKKAPRAKTLKALLHKEYLPVITSPENPRVGGSNPPPGITQHQI